MILGETDESCSGSVEMEVTDDGYSTGFAACESASGWSCTASWNHAYSFGEEPAKDYNIECQGPDSGGGSSGEIWIWGDASQVSGQYSVESGVFDWVSISFSAQPGI